MKDKLSQFLKEECFRLETENFHLSIDTRLMFALAFSAAIIATVLL